MRQVNVFSRKYSAFRRTLLSGVAIAFVFSFFGCSEPPPPPTAPTPPPVTIVIPPGASSATIAGILKDYGLIGSRRMFRMELKVVGKERQLKAGEYEVPLGLTASEIINLLSSGKVKRHRITIPEGLTVAETADYLGRGDLLNGPAILKLAKDPAFLARVNLPGTSLEGFLFPSTYFFPRHYPPEEVLLEMIANYRKAYSPDLRVAADRLRLTELEVVTLASMIEKETGQAYERPVISSVFHNRLARGMRLQSDPTTIYGILATRGRFNGNLTRADLLASTPYNTYTIRALPPGPIANPGAEALRASVFPEQTEFLFFVARGDGTHVFSRTLKEHNRAVEEFQIRRTRQAKR